MLAQPYHRRLQPKPQDGTWYKIDRIDLSNDGAHLPPYPTLDPSGVVPDSRPRANFQFDARAAAAVFAGVGEPTAVKIKPDRSDATAQRDSNGILQGYVDGDALLEVAVYHDSDISIIADKCLAAMVYKDYFPDSQYGDALRSQVSAAIMEAVPGWCGSYGPDVNDQGVDRYSGDYDFKQMFMLALVYNFYDVPTLTPQARERLINDSLAKGRVHRPNEDDYLTSGGLPNDAYLAGVGGLASPVVPIPETENHVLMIATARYLTNQLLYQRYYTTPFGANYDNRRNGCMDQLRGLLRNYLRDDFAEYNAKPYQEETRRPLLNLCSYAYDAEVRLGARMVLDYISAHIAISNNDLRRMVPFRRRDEAVNDRVKQIATEPGFMDVNLLQDFHGADPMTPRFALLAGNTRAYQYPDFEGGRGWSWAITPNFAPELTLDALSSYRLPPSIHDLFVNDLHRRFFQRIHRRPLEEPGGQRNCDNMELYSGSPSYLITAGGEPATYSIPGVTSGPIRIGFDETNKGVAVTTSFMPTGLSACRSSNSLQQLADLVGMSSRPISLKAVAQVFGISTPVSFRQVSVTAASRYPNPDSNLARDLIQIGHFSDQYGNSLFHGGRKNYGVAPDFACGFNVHLPAWTFVHQNGWSFVNRQSRGTEPAGFFLAIFKQHAAGGDFVVLEAFDTWRDRNVTFEQFKGHATRDNPNMQINSGEEAVYTTYHGNKIRFIIWRDGEIDHYFQGAKIINITYNTTADPADTLADAGNYTDQSQFLSGNILKSFGDANAEIHNPALGTKITLNWSDPSHLMRISENGEVEHAGKNEAGQLYEVWADFDWSGLKEGDFYRPFDRLAGAVAAVADGGVIKIAPGRTAERGPIGRGKRVKIVAPLGGVTIGAH